MDDDMRDKAREVFTELTSGGVSTTADLGTTFEHVFNNNFASWRVFFRAVKDLIADNESKLGELSGNGFLVGGKGGGTMDLIGLYRCTTRLRLLSYS